MGATRVGVKYFVGLLGFLTLMLAAAVTAQPAGAQAMDPMADLSVQKFDFPPTQVNVGEPLFYELNVANSTDSDTANNAVVVDDLPSNTEFLFTISGDCSNTGNTVTCDLGDLAPGELAVVEFAVCPTAPGTATNTATASSDTSDPDNSNNTATETTEVVGPDVGGCTTQEPAPPPAQPTPPPEAPQPEPGFQPIAAPAPPQTEVPGTPGLCTSSGILVVNEQSFSLVCVAGQIIATEGNVPGELPTGNVPVNGGAGGITVQNSGELVTADGAGISVQSPDNPTVTAGSGGVLVEE